MSIKKPLEFLGNSYDALCEFPKDARRLMGGELLLVQLGSMPIDFKPIPAVGKGVYEIRVHRQGAWRVLYVAKFNDAIYVLHAFQKKTQQTAKEDINLAAKRYRMIGE